jgi:hypothetical protein
MDVEAVSGPRPSVRHSIGKSSLLKCSFSESQRQGRLRLPDMDINQGDKEVFITGHSGKDSRL